MNTCGVALARPATPAALSPGAAATTLTRLGPAPPAGIADHSTPPGIPLCNRCHPPVFVPLPSPPPPPPPLSPMTPNMRFTAHSTPQYRTGPTPGGPSPVWYRFPPPPPPVFRTPIESSSSSEPESALEAAQGEREIWELLVI